MEPEDYLFKYPTINEYYSSNVGKAEFDISMLNSEIFDDTRLTLTQQFMKRFISKSTMNNRMLLFHGLGSGKTCMALLIAEQFRVRSLNLPTFPNKTLIITPNSILSKNYKEELMKDLCGPLESQLNLDEYVSDDDKNKHVNEVNRFITKRYAFVNHGQLSNELHSLNEDQVRDSYSNRIIVIDEVHELSTLNNAEAQKTCNNILKMLTYALHIKVLLLTGTPMKNEIKDVSYIFQLLGTTVPPFITVNGFNTKLVDETLDNIISNNLGNNETALLNFLKGKVSYIGKEENSANYVQVEYPEEGISEKLGLRFYKIYYLEFDPKVADVYKSSSKTGGFTTEKELMSLWILNIPRTKRDLEIIVKDNGEFRKHSPKYHALIKRIRELNSGPKHLKRKIFIYCRFIKNEGLDLLKRILNIEGFIEATHTGYTTPNNRYISITGEETKHSTKLAELINFVNAPENEYGDFVQLVLVSEAGSHGISFKDFGECHILTAWWNPSIMDQIEGRVIRKNSHTRWNEKHYDNERKADVLYYHYVVGTTVDEEVISNDLNMYISTERKDIELKKMERVLKMVSVDCLITNTQNNERLESLDYSKECDYQLCNYTCVVQPKDTLDYSTISRFVSDSFKKNVVSMIKTVLRHEGKVSLNTIVQMLRFPQNALKENALKDVPATEIIKIITDSLDTVLFEPVYDKYFFPSWIRYSSDYLNNGTYGYVFLVRNPVSRDHYSEVYNNIFTHTSDSIPKFNSKTCDTEIADFLVNNRSYITNVLETLTRKLTGNKIAIASKVKRIMSMLKLLEERNLITVNIEGTKVVVFYNPGAGMFTKCYEVNKGGIPCPGGLTTPQIETPTGFVPLVDKTNNIEIIENANGTSAMRCKYKIKNSNDPKSKGRVCDTIPVPVLKGYLKNLGKVYTGKVDKMVLCEDLVKILQNK